MKEELIKMISNKPVENFINALVIVTYYKIYNFI